MHWKVLSTEMAFSNKYLGIVKDICLLPNGMEIDYYSAVLRDWVAVVACTEKKEIILVKQYRHPTGEELIELPAGAIDDNEAEIHAATRELEEETGYQTISIEPLGSWHTSSAKTAARCHIYFATITETPKDQNLDPVEDIEVIKVPAKEALKMALNGEITSTTTIAGILFVKEKYPEVFE